MVSTERGRGILSEADRNYALNNEQWAKGKSRPAINQRETAIIDRVRNSMLDFQHLADGEFPEKLLDQVFHLSEEGFNAEEHGPVSIRQFGTIDIENQNPRIEDSCIAAVALIYRMFSPTFANSIIERGVRQAVHDFYPDHEIVDASYNPELRSPSEVHDRAKNFLENGITLSDDQIRLLLERGEIDPQKIADHVQQDTRSYHESNREKYLRNEEVDSKSERD